MKAFRALAVFVTCFLLTVLVAIAIGLGGRYINMTVERWLAP